ncbi:uncharacterized protein B0H64DRAFT_462218 [Chaetomium fimeti]|uniref:Aminoglycoside phosphotransferase domain-containing protein n=1 Tax=Chaetomium fimeti TaxID=1854472 RepID=A0AAE0HC81_9PEZI|nr:hypothetical protein B0H64DRAFT_462218 [Chaetomium fimeti]
MALNRHMGSVHDIVVPLIQRDLIGPAKGKGIIVDFVTEDDDTAVYVAALVPLPTPEDHAINRHLIHLHMTTGDVTVLSVKPVLIETDEMEQILLDNKLGTLKTYQRISNESSGTTYKVTVEEPDKPQLIVQLRFHGSVVSMNALQDYIRTKAPPGLPVPRTFPTISTNRSNGLQLQITEFIPSTMAEGVFKNLSIEDRVPIVRQMACAFAALWELPVLKENNDIGEAIASPPGQPNGLLNITVGPEERVGIGGPFNSVSGFLKAWVLHRLEKLEDQDGIDEYQAMFLPSIRAFVHNKLDSRLPEGLDKIPVVLMHADLVLHNVLLSESPPFELAAVIDWESTLCLPFLCAVPPLIERMLQEGLEGEKEPVLIASQPLREAFWNEIPAWKELMTSPEGQAFLEWYEFGLYMVAEAVYMELDASPEERMASWERNISVVKRFLGIWGQEEPSL